MPVTFADFVEIMARLRAPDGCPWDREQTYASLAPMMLEEAYEAFEAVEAAIEGHPNELRDELGDLLLQIVFYAQVAKERGEFTIDDVVESIHSKMIRRHPHVFGDEQADTTEAVLRNWEAIKAEERKAAGKLQTADDSILDGVSPKIPALMEAHQISAKAARVGFDWPTIEGVFDKIDEEITELKEALADRAALPATATEAQRDEVFRHLRGEVGDLLFIATNLARFVGIEPEAALKSTNRKFRQRFRHIENHAADRGVGLETLTSDEMEAAWQAAKAAEKS